MRVLLRADATIEQGTGHVMRCLTLGERLAARGHHVSLMSGGLATDWLRDVVSSSGIALHDCTPDEIDGAAIDALGVDWVVVDSYRIPASSISQLNRHVPVLAIVDGDNRGIEAAIYLDQNLGAEAGEPAPRGRTLAGSAFALVRDAVLAERRAEPWRLHQPRPGVLSFMGGTDPTASSLVVATALAAQPDGFDLTMIAPADQHAELARILDDRDGVALIAPTGDLPRLLGSADVVVSAAGTSAWDLCTLAVPSLLIAVVDNQSPSLTMAVDGGLVLGIDASQNPVRADEVATMVRPLLDDLDLRRALSTACSRAFDGQGTSRVVDEMERALARTGTTERSAG